MTIPNAARERLAGLSYENPPVNREAGPPRGSGMKAEVVHVASIKQIDGAHISDSVRRTGAAVTAELASHLRRASIGPAAGSR